MAIQCIDLTQHMPAFDITENWPPWGAAGRIIYCCKHMFTYSLLDCYKDSECRTAHLIWECTERRFENCVEESYHYVW